MAENRVLNNIDTIKRYINKSSNGRGLACLYPSFQANRLECTSMFYLSYLIVIPTDGNFTGLISYLVVCTERFPPPMSQSDHYFKEANMRTDNDPKYITN